MPNTFLIQIREQSYRKIIETGTYDNLSWRSKARDRAQGEVEPGDTILFYCAGNVPQYPLSIAFRADVESVTDDKRIFTLGELRWFPNPLSRDQVLALVNSGELEETFRSCGAQGFNIAKLQEDSLSRILRLVESSSGLTTVSSISRPGPLDGLIETKLEDYIVQHWSEVNFGASLTLYSENGEAVGQQYDTGEIGRIDLLCQDEDTGDVVIIELKRGRPSDEVIGQLARYIGWAQERIAQGRKVRGIVLTPAVDARLRYAVRAIPNVKLLRYQIKFEITPGDS